MTGTGHRRPAATGHQARPAARSARRARLARILPPIVAGFAFVFAVAAIVGLL
ncbi:hypothetical protein GN330_15665 [Nitratireductor sp. CAU 1489]|uniref:Uncharacterized protein n=1 Tax=Nitratireductor arenosus TaxID=2682096 RepID=A0A844QJA8_9HYPH|nr:hypothetical protein [Nitratireductor arenosus]MVA98684.1 hypothetical protein [Nitratireductor arenosus]